MPRCWRRWRICSSKCASSSPARRRLPSMNRWAGTTRYLARHDFSTEMPRGRGWLRAYVTKPRHILKKGGQVGKRLDFMMQELNREANTVGSKSAMKELADAAMELKLLIDQM